MFEYEDLDSGSGRIEQALVLYGTGHFALQATGALVRCDGE
jgi:hypothetical protein